MNNDPAVDYLLKRVMGLQAVVSVLMAHLIKKGATDEQSLLFALDAFLITADVDEDQRQVFEGVKNLITGKGVWIPQVIQGGKSKAPDPAGNPNGEEP